MIDHFGGIVIGGNAKFGDNCRIRIGDNVVIGANAMVVCDVPDECVAVGVPAMVKPGNGRGASSRADGSVAEAPASSGPPDE